MPGCIAGVVTSTFGITVGVETLRPVFKIEGEIFVGTKFVIQQAVFTAGGSVWLDVPPPFFGDAEKLAKKKLERLRKFNPKEEFRLIRREEVFVC